MLTSLEIKNFRTFSHLRIERLGRVNLIVGKNNVGKTTLLEAFSIVGSTWPPMAIRSILQARNEVQPSTELASSGQRVAHYALESLFHGREMTAERKFKVAVGSTPDEYHEISGRHDLGDRSDRCLAIDSRFGPWRLNSNGSAYQPEYYAMHNAADLPTTPLPLVDMLSGPGMEATAGGWWDDVWLPSGRERVLKLLKTVAPVEDVIFVSDPRSQPDRIAKAQIEGVHEPMPLVAMGGGLVRLFYIALAMEYAEKRAQRIVAVSEQPRDVYAFVLIDEVESGIHHSLHADLWSFVFRAARQLDVQVFATTHSWDCVKGFQKALATDKEADGLVIRLERKEDIDKARAVIIDEEDLPIVARENIEVR